MTIPEIVKDIIKEEHITQTHLAKKLGVSKQMVSHIMKQQDMRINTVVKILHAIGYDIFIQKRRK